MRGVFSHVSLPLHPPVIDAHTPYKGPSRFQQPHQGSRGFIMPMGLAMLRMFSRITAIPPSICRRV